MNKYPFNKKRAIAGDKAIDRSGGIWVLTHDCNVGLWPLRFRRISTLRGPERHFTVDGKYLAAGDHEFDLSMLTPEKKSTN